MTIGRFELGVGVLAGAALLLLPTVFSSSYTLLQMEYILSLVMVALGVNVVMGYAGQLALGPGAALCIGAYAAAILANDFPHEVGLLAMCGVGVAAAAVSGVVIGIPSLRVSGFYLGMTTLLIALVVPAIVSNISWAGSTTGISLISNTAWNQRHGGTLLYEMTAGAVLVITVACYLLRYSRVGRRFVVLAASEELATSVGISSYRTKVLAFFLSALPAGVGGAFYVYTQQFMSTDSVTTTTSIYVLAACVVGGLGTVVGPLVGGLLVFGLSQFLVGFDQYEGIAFGLLLIGFSIFMPDGLVGFGGGRGRAVIPWARRDPRPVESDVPPSRRVDLPLEAPPAWGDEAEAGAALEVLGARRAFGGVLAVDGVDLTIRRGTLHGMIGSNGSGKTTLLNLISGYYRLEGGSIRVGEARVDGQTTDRVAALGITRTFQTPKLVEHETVLANVLHAAETADPCRGISSVLRLPSGRRSLRTARATAMGLLAQVGLEALANRPAGALSHGNRRLVEIARALALRPRFLLLDEPGAGLSLAEMDVLREIILAVVRSGVGVLLVEHNVPFVLDLAQDVTVLHEGRRLASGTPEQIRSDPAVASSFVGSRRPLEPPTEMAARLRSASEQDAVNHGTLRVDELRAGYGRMEVVSGVSFEVSPGEIVSMVGRNGAGKTTTLLAVAGARSGSAGGTVRLGEVDLTGRPPADIVRAGVALVPEGHRIFHALTVHENLGLGAFPWRRSRRDAIGGLRERVYELFPVLAKFAPRLAGELSGGQQQMVAMGQALMADPSILLLDEPSSGLAPGVVDAIYDVIEVLRKEGRGILLVEQDVSRALSSADRTYVLDQGRVLTSGRSADLSRDGRVADIVRGIDTPTS